MNIKEKPVLRKTKTRLSLIKTPCALSNSEQCKKTVEQVENVTKPKKRKSTGCQPVLSKPMVVKEKKSKIFQVPEPMNDDEWVAQILGEEDQEFVMIGCKIPNGVVVRVGASTILLRGIHDMPGNGGGRHYDGIGFTKIQKKIWNNFLQNHQEWPLLVNRTVFVSESKALWWEDV